LDDKFFLIIDSNNSAELLDKQALEMGSYSFSEGMSIWRKVPGIDTREQLYKMVVNLRIYYFPLHITTV